MVDAPRRLLLWSAIGIATLGVPIISGGAGRIARGPLQHHAIASTPAPSIGLSTNCAEPNDLIEVGGQHFDPRALITITLGGTRIGGIKASGVGTFNLAIWLPRLMAPGQYTMTVSEPGGVHSVTTPFQIFVWTQAGGGADHTGANPCDSTLYPGNLGQLSHAWDYQLPVAGDDFRAAPALDTSTYDGALYIAWDGISTGMELDALNATTGSVLWSFTSTTLSVDSDSEATAYANGIVYLAATGTAPSNLGSYLYALNARTGATLWTVTVPNGSQRTAIITTPVVSGNTVYVGGDVLAAYNATTGAPLWSSTASAYGFGIPTVGGGNVYVSGADDVIYAFGATTGTAKWSYTIGDFVRQLAYANGAIFYAQSYPYVVGAINTTTGKAIWTRSDVSSPTDVPVAAAYGLVFVNFGGNDLWALSAATGNTQFRIIFPYLDSIYGTLTIADGVIFTPAGNGYLYAFDILSRTEVWSTSLPGGGDGYNPGVVVAGGSLYIANMRDLEVLRLPWLRDPVA